MAELWGVYCEYWEHTQIYNCQIWTFDFHLDYVSKLGTLACVYTVRGCYKAVQYNMILHIAQKWLKQNWYQG